MKSVTSAAPVGCEGALAVEPLEHALYGAGAPAAGHLDIELVGVFRHC